MAITTSIVVQFASKDAEAKGILMAEIDDREEGLNAGNTSFEPAATAYFLVYKSSNVSYQTPQVTAGNILSAAGGTREIKDEFITFTGGDSGNTQYPAEGAVAYKWVGRNGGAVTVSGEGAIKVKPVTDGDPVFGVLAVDYTTRYEAWGIKSPSSILGYTTFPIVAFIVGELS